MTQNTLHESDFEEESLINSVNFESDIMTDTHKKQLETQLWNIANTLRGKMNADEFRDYILGFIFYKYLSEQMHLYANKILKEDGIKYEDIDENSDEGQEYLEAIKEESVLQLGYFLKPSELFHAIAKRRNGNGKKKFILDDLANILNNIEQSTMGTDSEDDFDKLFEDLDLTSTKLGRTESAKNELISKVLSHLDEIDFQLENTELDVLGDAYEYLIAQFASGAGKKAGEFYTPQEVSRVLAKLVTTGKTKLKSVYDPTCGSGSLLLRVAKEVKEVSAFYGQELNRTTYNLARMNMILHGVHYRKFDIRQEDTLEKPQHIDERFEAIVANPPFSADWSANPLHMSDDRFSQYGKLAPKKKADFAFVQHMIYHLTDNGQMAVVLPHGALYRGSSEAHIRKYLIEDRNYLDAVIGLPSNIFYGTSIPTCILVFKKCREHPDNILFIDANEFFEKNKNQNRLREQDIDRIISTYRERKSIDEYSHVATLNEVKENEYNLNIRRYVDTYKEENILDINKVSNELKALRKELMEIDLVINSYCDELKIPKPIGENLPLIKEYKKSVARKIFSKKIRFKDNDDKDYPDWNIKELGVIGKTYNGLTGKTKEDFGKGKPYINYKQIFDNSKIDINKFDYVKIKEGEKQSLARYGDVFFTTSSETPNEVGFASVLLDNVNELYLNSFCFGYRPNSFEILNPKFSRFLFRSSDFRRSVYKLAQGSTRYNMSKIQFLKTKVSLPCKVEQEKIANFLTAIEDKITLIGKMKF